VITLANSTEDNHRDKPKGKYLDKLSGDEFFIHQAMNTDPQKGMELLFRKYYQELCSHAVRYVISRDIAQDLVSDILYTFYKEKHYLQITISFRYYLFKSVRNRAFNYLKSEIYKIESFDDISNHQILDGQTPESISEFEELYQDLQFALDRLPVERRKIYLMNKFDRKKYQEIADELNLSVKTIEVQIYRANKFIKEFLKKRWELMLILLHFLFPQ
jgi:RNA polymerase sigma-70 factor (family 1)